MQRHAAVVQQAFVRGLIVDLGPLHRNQRRPALCRGLCCGDLRGRGLCGGSGLARREFPGRGLPGRQFGGGGGSRGQRTRRGLPGRQVPGCALPRGQIVCHGKGGGGPGDHRARKQKRAGKPAFSQGNGGNGGGKLQAPGEAEKAGRAFHSRGVGNAAINVGLHGLYQEGNRGAPSQVYRLDRGLVGPDPDYGTGRQLSMTPALK
ncbi:hypothetical protein D3C86_1193770 [compost metagenome]